MVVIQVPQHDKYSVFCHIPFLGCLYRVADSSDDEVFCFMENGEYPSQCLLGKAWPKYFLICEVKIKYLYS